MSNSIEERVKKIIVDQLCVKPEDVVPAASFVDDLGADSLDTVELVMALEEEFKTEIPDEEAEKINTVQAAIDYIEKHHLDCELEVDGGVSTKTAKTCTSSGADVLVTGSAFFKAEDQRAFTDFIRT